MPTVTVQKNKTIAVQKQSLKLVQLFLHRGLSVLTWQRGLLPANAYTNERIAPDLQRGKSKRVDQFLGWEDDAVSHLQAGTLREVRIYVHDGSHRRERIIEAYTFKIDYDADARSDTIPTSTGLDHPKLVHTISAAFGDTTKMFLDKTASFCKALPLLPKERRMSMELSTTEGAPVCDGWVCIDTDTISLAHAPGWQRCGELLQEQDFMLHRATCGISYLQYQGYRRDRASLPDQLRFDNHVHHMALMDSAAQYSTFPKHAIEQDPVRAHASGVQSFGAQAPKLGRTRDMPKTDSAPSLEHRSAAVCQAQKCQMTRLTAGTQAEAVRPQLPLSLDTQSSNIQEMRTALRKMMLPESISQGDTQAADLSQVSEASQPTEEVECEEPLSQLSADVISTAELGRLGLLPSGKVRLRHDVLLRIEIEVGRGAKRVAGISCQCGHPDEEGVMISCTICGSQQHLHCYGFTGVDDPRQPNRHVCYCCLIGPTDRIRLTDMSRLALTRRGTHHAATFGLHKQRDFAEQLKLEMSVGAPLYQELIDRKTGYVVAAPGSKKKGYSGTGRPLYVVAKIGTARERMISDLFNPMRYIGHFYECTPEPLEMRATPKPVLATQEMTMPPPATPASQLKDRPSTSESDLDISIPRTPFETPNLPSSRRTLKRSWGRGLREDLTPVKRHQTLRVLNASGLPSSPATPK